MVVKASTKPWPRQLGSSIMRALPPQSQAGPGQVKSVRSEFGRPPKAYYYIARHDGQREEEKSRWARRPRGSRLRPRHVVDAIAIGSSRDRAHRRRAARRCLADVLVAARPAASRRRGPGPRFFCAPRRRLSPRRVRAIRSAAADRSPGTSARTGRGCEFAAAWPRSTRTQQHDFARVASAGAGSTYAMSESVQILAPSLTAHAASSPHASVGAPTATEWSGSCILSAMY